MIPILYQSSEVAFTSNGIGRLRDCISCIVTEERNGIYECDFEYPVNGANYELIQIGRIVGVTHDDTGDIQPFDIVSYSRPIDGVVTFHCTHISYRQSYMTVTGSNINSLSAAFTLLNSATPSNPFTYWTDKSSTGYLGCANGIPRTVRQTLGGIEGSILDAYGGEYEWDKWVVRLHNNRGVYRDFSIRYGVNMLEFQDDTDMTGTYSSCIPYWTNGEETVVAAKTDSGSSTLTGRGECIPLDLSEKFETKPTTTQLKNTAKSYMLSNNTYNATKNISVSFVRLQDMGEYADYQNLLRCGLCDTINVVFPDYDSSGQFKIVKTVWDVLQGRYEEMELGDLSISLADALGVTETLEKMYTIPTKTSDLVNDSGFVGSPTSSNIILKNNVRLQGRDTTDANTYSLAYVSTNNRGALGSTSIPTVLQGSNGNSSGILINYLGQYTQLFDVIDKEITVGAINAHSYQSAADYSISVPTNYVPVGIVGYTSDNYRIRPTTNYIKNNSTLNMGFANASTTNVSAGTTVHVKILCLKATSA